LNIVEGLPARQAALELTTAALARRGGLEDTLTKSPFAALEPRERLFARALAMTTLRRLGQIDRLLDGKLQKPPPDAVRQILRLGAAQLFWMEAADHAAVSTAVDMAAARSETRPFKGLVNGVLRSLLRDGRPADAPEALVPSWLLARWRAAYGEADAQAMAAAVADEPATDLTAKDPADAAALAPEIEGEALPGGTVRTRQRGDLTSWPGFAEGRWWVQDSSSAVPARLLNVKPGETALDMAAAPGGKTMQLAAAGATVTALDRSPARIGRVKDNLERVGLHAGAYRRHPDALWTTRPPDIAGLAGAQAKLLAAAAERTAPGGRLVYCVCSLEPEEGEAQVEAFLASRPDFRLDPILPGEGGAPEASLTPKGWLRILPHHREGGADGFFAARMVRAAG
jgi:16S rRNA (cytosine967-C5)-methyltransferase